MQSADQLEAYASTPGGRSMMDVLTEALLTGHVTAFESVQAERILNARGTSISSEDHRQDVHRIARLRHRAEDDAGQLQVDLRAQQIAESLLPVVRTGAYREVSAALSEQSSDIEDNVAAHFLELQSTPDLEKYARSPDGRAMLNRLYEATITGVVTEFERMQTDRVLAAQARTSEATDEQVAKVLQDPSVFPLASGWGSTATIVAELLADGKVKVFYDSYTGASQAEFREEMNTLLDHYGESQVYGGIPLDPAEIVVVKLYDQGGRRVPVPAITLIDFFNQQKESTLGKIKAVSGLAATVGLGGVGAAGVLGWADTIAFTIDAASLFINEYRDEIAKTALGQHFLDAWDVATGIVGVYGWARLGIDGLRLVHHSVAPAFERWRAEAPTDLDAAERQTIAEAQQKTANWLDSVERAETAEAAKHPGEHPTAGPGKHPTTGEPGTAAEAGDAHQHGTGQPGPTAKPTPTTTKVVAGGESEVHVSGERIEVCQRCPDLEEAVGDAKSDKRVAGEVSEAEQAAAHGDPATAAAKAEAAVLDANKVTAAKVKTLKATYKRELSIDPVLQKRWEAVDRMSAGPRRTAAAHEFETALAERAAANDAYLKQVREGAKQLRDDAARSKAGVTALHYYYAWQPEWVLQDLKDVEDAAVAELKKRRIRPAAREATRDPMLREELDRKHAENAYERAVMSKDRPPHEADVLVVDANGTQKAAKHYKSGGVTEEQRAEHGLNEANSRSHTEAQAIVEYPLHKGETMYITGTYDPCSSCFRRMQAAVEAADATIVYWWPGGPKDGLVFRKGAPPEWSFKPGTGE